MLENSVYIFLTTLDPIDHKHVFFFENCQDQHLRHVAPNAE